MNEIQNCKNELQNCNEFYTTIANAFEYLEIEALDIGDAETYNFSGINHHLMHCYFLDFCEKLEMKFGRLTTADGESINFSYSVKLHCHKLFLIYWTYCDPQYEWSCQNCADASESLLQVILQIHENTHIHQILKGNLIKKILPLLQIKLTRDLWKRYPATYTAFVSLICHCGWDCLTPFLSEVLPPILWMIDDYNATVNLLGLDALKSVFRCVPKAEIRMYGRSEVLYDALVKKLYERNAPVLQGVLQCMLNCLRILEHSVVNSEGPPCKITRYDKVIQIILSNLTSSCDIKLSRVYLKEVQAYIAIIGMSTTKHLKYVLPLIEHYLQSGDTECNEEAIAIINQLTKLTWPRFKVYVPVILKMLTEKLMSQVNATDLFIEEILQCVATMKSFDEPAVQKTLNLLREQSFVELYPAVHLLLKQT